MKTLLAFIITAASAICSCAPIQQTAERSTLPSEYTGYETYLGIQTTLENCGDTIDYDTLMNVYTSIVQSHHPIPNIDQLLKSLINKKNDNPRIDQMILIFSARAIGDSKFQIPDAYEIFESILKKNNTRVNEWVISFVAASIGKYPFDIPNGDRLVDFLEQRLNQISALTSSDSKEFFGFHFMPPPHSGYILSYLEGIKEQRKREVERMYYYSLIHNRISETEIETALERLRKQGVPATGEKCHFPMKYLLINKNSVFSGFKKEDM